MEKAILLDAIDAASFLAWMNSISNQIMTHRNQIKCHFLLNHSQMRNQPLQRQQEHCRAYLSIQLQIQVLMKFRSIVQVSQCHQQFQLHSQIKIKQNLKLLAEGELFVNPYAIGELFVCTFIQNI